MSDVLMLGHSAIDALHGEMVQLIHAAIAARDGQRAELLAQLYRHTEHHFSQEEALMVQSGYRGLSEHRGEHRQLLGEMQGMMRALERGRTPLVQSWLRDRVPEWVRLHVTQLDAQLVAFLNK